MSFRDLSHTGNAALARYHLRNAVCPLCLFLLELDWDGHYPRCVFERGLAITFSEPRWLTR